MTTNAVAATCFAKCVKFVNENDARRFGFGLLEHVTDTSRTHANEHLDKVAS